MGETLIEPGSRGRCPHCNTVVLFEDLGEDQQWFHFGGRRIGFIGAGCPNCGEPSITLTMEEGEWNDAKVLHQSLVWPRSVRASVAEQVPAHIAQDYLEAWAVLPHSAKASAALARRCLQTVLVEAGKAKSHRLSSMIKEVKPGMPSYVADELEAVKHAGDFSAHPLKDKATGQILDVARGEAQWVLHVLDLLFDHYYVKPAQSAAFRTDFNKKLEAAGRKPFSVQNDESKDEPGSS